MLRRLEGQHAIPGVGDVADDRQSKSGATRRIEPSASPQRFLRPGRWNARPVINDSEHDCLEPDTRAPIFQFFNVAISSPDKAIEAARKKAGAPTDAPMRIVRELSHQEIAALSLHAGHVKAA